MRVLVLFDGAGLARLGLERAGHECTGIELDPLKHRLSELVGSGKCYLDDARNWGELTSAFDAVWCSPPCVRRTSCIKDLTKADGLRDPEYQGDHLSWCLGLEAGVLWVENVTMQGAYGNEWGTAWNAAQFLKKPIQNRNRIIGGKYKHPKVQRPYTRWHPGICPSITATEYKASGATDKCRASRFYGRNLTVEECAYHQGFKIPKGWYDIPFWFLPGNRHRQTLWRRNLYEAIGNGVPVYMAEAFGRAYK